MIVNHHNIEKWMFDYFEGNLTLHEQVELRQFLKTNPQYISDLEAWEQSRIEEEEEEPVYVGAESLMVSESSLFAKSWKLAAVFLLLIGVSSLGYLWYGSQQYEERNQTSLNSNGKKIPNIFNTNFNPYANFNLIKGVNATRKIDENSLKESMVVSSLSKSEIIALEENKSLEEINPQIIEEIKNIRQQKDLSEYALTYLALNGDNLIKSNFNGTLDQRIIKGEVYDRALDGPEIKDRGSKWELFANRDKSKKGFYEKLEDMFDRKLGLTNIQDPVFLQINEDPFIANVATIGNTFNPRVKFGYRNQWNNSNNNTSSYTMSYDQYSSQLMGGVAITAGYNDFKNGMYSDYNLGVGYAPRFQISRYASLTAGVHLSMNQKRIAFDKYKFGEKLEQNIGDVKEAYDAGNSPTASRIYFRDVKAGLMLNTSHFYIGVSGDHLTEPIVDLYKSNEDESHGLKQRYSVQIGTDYQKETEGSVVVSPQLIFNTQGGNSEVWASTVMRYRKIMGGIGVSSNMSAKALVGIGGNKVRLTYSFDIANSIVENKRLTSHEASLRILFKNKQSLPKLAYLR